MRTLRRCAVLELSTLRESDDPRTARDRYINDFLMAKVLDAERFSDSPLESVGALVFYFRNFLKTAIRSERFHRDMGEYDEGRNAGEDDAHRGCADAGSDDASDSESAVGWLDQARQFACASERATRYCCSVTVPTSRYSASPAATTLLRQRTMPASWASPKSMAARPQPTAKP